MIQVYISFCLYALNMEVQMNNFNFGTSVGTNFSYEKTSRKKIGLISGITGQDGSYLAEILLDKGYQVHGIIRRSATSNTKNIDHLKENIILHYGDLTCTQDINNIIYEVQPHELYNLGAQSHVRISFDTPEYTSNVVALGALRCFEAVRNFARYAKVYHASTSELYGNAFPPQNENTSMVPNSPYAIAKLYAHRMAQLYRESYGLFISCGILFNHESPRRGEEFVTQKIIKGLINCKNGKQQKLFLGNLDAKRDWGFSKDYMEAAYTMLQQDEPDDYVIGTGESYSVKEFLEVAADYIKIKWKDYVEIDSNLFRPTETNFLLADSKKAREKLGWKPKVDFNQLVKIMIESELSKGG